MSVIIASRTMSSLPLYFLFLAPSPRTLRGEYSKMILSGDHLRLTGEESALPVLFSQFALNDGLFVRSPPLADDFHPETLQTVGFTSSLIDQVLVLIHDSSQASHPREDRCLP